MESAIFVRRGGELTPLFEWLHAESEGPGGLAASADCQPPADVRETDDAVQVDLDLPGVSPTDVRVAVADGQLVVAGRKPPHRCHERSATFHLAERRFGRFVCVVPLSGAVDLSKATATLADGELRILLPRLADRRRREIPIAVSRGR